MDEHDEQAAAPESPARVYTARLAARRAHVESLARRGLQISRWRVLCFLAVALVLLAWGSGIIALAWALLPALGFAWLVVRHEGAAREQARAEGAARYYEAGLRRLDGTWPGHGVTRVDLVADEHPYATDLDVFGEGSLFERVCTAKTRAGERALADWLAAPASIDELRTRHEAIAELRENLTLREELGLLGHALQSSVDVERLLSWAERPSALEGRAARTTGALAWILTLLSLVGLGLWILSSLGPLPLLGVLALEGLAYRARQREIQDIIRGVDGLTRDMAVLAEVFARLERERFTCARLVALRGLLVEGARGGSQEIAALARLVDWLEARRSGLFAPLAFAWMWTWHFGLAIERWRQRAGASARRWVEGLGELEALIALAGYAYENPEDPLPELRELAPGDAPRLILEDAGHPLLTRDACVTNSVSLGEPVRVMIVSGSNMSGKSTLLRTIGCNVVLALAGAPVRARRMSLCPLRVGASLRVEDSLLGGRSRFYAGILRLRDIVALARGPEPALFLLDEILHGTNSHDRRIGAEAIVRGLVESGAVGLVTTHDLALAKVADALGERAINVHFADELEEGELRFDYRMRPGVVDRSNALALMRAVGLEV
ncbi:MAG: DNA mismatch repair protein MutS [Myxococcales bacterium]|nr:DNA mismatch repair protein MutS [Myxococcales bacterium]MCB9754167.1 DNA mismatch repair protein MutS [Myxococcales bacterium]